METFDEETQQSRGSGGSIGLNDVLFILYKHKWKILVCALVGFVAAATVYFMPRKTSYQSTAKLLVKYVVDRSLVDSGMESNIGSTSQSVHTMLGAEFEILGSYDLALDVAQAIGPENLVINAGPDVKVSLDEAASQVRNGLRLSYPKGNTVITIGFRHPDPEMSRRVLEEVVTRYLKRHLDIHRSQEAFDIVSQKVDEVRSRLRQTEIELKDVMLKSEIISLDDTRRTLSTYLTKAREDVLSAEEQLAEQAARVKEVQRWADEAARASAEFQSNKVQLAASRTNSPAEETLALPEPEPPVVVDRTIGEKLDSVVRKLAQARITELDLLARYTSENPLVRVVQDQISTLEKQRVMLEEMIPKKTGSPSSTASVASLSGPDVPELLPPEPIKGSTPEDLLRENARYSAAAARLEMLKARLKALTESASKFADVQLQITQLERRKTMEEGLYRQLESSLEKARVDEALDPSRMPNISTVQKPSSPVPVVEELNQKLVKGLAAGGLMLGLGLAFLIELVIDPSVKRPGELETRYRIPVLFSVPRIANRRRKLLPASAAGKEDADGPLPVLASDAGQSAWLPGHFIRPFCDSIRDRLILYFQIKSMTHKPKLVAVAGCAGGEGTSTIAGGLAASLSETGDGKVLLVNMNAGQEQMHPFFKGRMAGSLEEALQLGHSEDLDGQNLFMASGDVQGHGPLSIAPKKFYDLLPNLKASDFDYIIFDMPPLAESSATLAMAGFMDKMLLVVQSEKTSKHLVKRTYSELVAARADVSCIFNRVPTDLPKFLEA